jgi:hypothetical protein
VRAQLYILLSVDGVVWLILVSVGHGEIFQLSCPRYRFDCAVHAFLLQNIMFAEASSVSSIRLVDFGLATVCEDDDTMRTLCGTWVRCCCATVCVCASRHAFNHSDELSEMLACLFFCPSM